MIRHFITAVLFMTVSNLFAQTQDDFMAKISEVYTNATDKKKALESARVAYQMAEGKDELQTYSNYLMLKQIFESVAEDMSLAAACKEKSDKLLNAMIGTAQNASANYGDEATNKWLNELYPSLFTISDPKNAEKADQFLAKNTSLQNFNNYNYVGYAYERNGNYPKANESYEHAISLSGNDRTEFHSYSYYANFLVRSGEYLKAEEYIRRMERLATEASDIFKISYKSEALVTKVVYYLSIGDYSSYLKASNEQYDHFANVTNLAGGCDTYTMSRYTLAAHAKEMLKDLEGAQQLWKKRDSSHYAWLKCHNEKYPNYQQYPLSMYPVYMIKSGQRNAIDKPLSFYQKEAETHFDSYKEYSDLSINFMKGVQLGFLHSPQYREVFKPILQKVVTTKDFRESTQPFSFFAYFTMRDRQLNESAETYDKLFALNADWINDIIFTFGEKAFVAYYNAKLRDGYDNYHSFVRLARESHFNLFPKLASQAYNNLLFTKSLSLKGSQRRKQAFRKSNDQSVIKMYDEWIDKKQQLIRLYRKSEDNTADNKSINEEQLRKLQEEVNHLENELAAKSKDFKKYLKLELPDWKKVRNNLKEGEAAIEMVRFQLRDQVYYSDTAIYAAYYITRNSEHPDVIYLPTPAVDLDNRYYKLYQNSIQFQINDNNSYKIYWKPVMDQLKGIKKIYFSPDGIYHLINLPTLLNPETGRYLLDDVDIHYTTSSNDAGASSSGEAIHNAVLFGRPAYLVDRPVQQQQQAVTRSFVANFRENNINDLPGTEEEVISISKELQNLSIKVDLHIREKATESQIYQLQAPDILHIATHGYWSEAGNEATDGFRMFNAMVNSGLLMSGVVNYYRSDELPETHDGILTAYEAQNLNLDNTELVVLSACETSLGHMDAGEGVYGLQRAFRAAGAKSIMTSLWKVDDAATREFMVLFYKEYLKTKDKFAAFRTAQQNLKEQYPQPYYWGAFTLCGN